VLLALFAFAVGFLCLWNVHLQKQKIELIGYKVKSINEIVMKVGYHCIVARWFEIGWANEEWKRKQSRLYITVN